MSIATSISSFQPEPELLRQTVVVIGGSAGIGLETARRARAEGARLILAARIPERLEDASRKLGAQSTAAFDAALAVHLMTNTALTGATYDIDGGQQLVDA
jgi:NADP-dependent 3-hydroxy acid dehydrogenase YdfG